MALAEPIASINLPAWIEPACIAAAAAAVAVAVESLLLLLLEWLLLRCFL